MLERTDAITNEVLETIAFVVAHPTVLDFNLNPGKLMTVTLPYLILRNKIYYLIQQ